MKHISDYLDEAMLCFYQERAAILEFEAGYPREKAEALAKAEAETWAKRKQEQDGKA